MAARSTKPRRRRADILSWLGEIAIRPKQSGYHGPRHASLDGDARFAPSRTAGARGPRPYSCDALPASSPALRWILGAALVRSSIEHRSGKSTLWNGARLVGVE